MADFLYSPTPESHVSRRLKVLAGIGGVLAVTAIALFFFVRFELTKSFPQTSGALTVQALKAHTDIARDEYGVPRIAASNDHDALYAMGFVHAQDRLWQMDMQRRAASGRLSEIFGKGTLPFDRMFRIVGLSRIAAEIERQLPDRTRRDIQAYCEGVNAWRAMSLAKLPIEFDLLRYDPEPWTPTDCILVGRLIAWELNISWWTDITYGTLVGKLGRDTVAQILPSYPATVPPEVPSEDWRRYATMLHDYQATAENYSDYFGRSLTGGGSNAWVAGPSRSATGAVLLANDTHLHLTQPSQWYEMDVTAPGFSVHGMSIPGVPGIVAGRNDSIAWGITNLMADDADFYIERLDPGDSLYWFDNAWHPLSLHDEEIGVRGDTAATLRVRMTRNGPIVSDIRTPLNKSTPPFVASMRWVGAEVDDQIGAFLHVDRARNWAEFVEGLRSFAVPGQNFIYGDVRGNIGYYCAARLPLRATGSGLLPAKGWEKNAGWTGFVPFEQLPHMLNPPSGYIASANNKTVDDSYPYHIGDLWEHPSRIMRLHELFGTPDTKITAQDCARWQNDTYSPLAKELTPYLLAASADSVLGQEYGELVREYLRNWDFRFGADDIATSIYQEFLVRLLHNIYEDEMGEELFHDFTMLQNIPLRVTSRLMREGTSVWFDDCRTTVVETRDDIVRRSALEAVEDLVARQGKDSRLWRWGELHTVTLQHPFGLQRPLDKIFSIGPFPYPGGSTALTSGEYNITAPFAVTVGPSFRQIFSLANPASHLAVLPSGQSGQVYHAHYSDQTRLWLHGIYRTVQRGPAGDSGEHLLLLPAGASP